MDVKAKYAVHVRYGDFVVQRVLDGTDRVCKVLDVLHAGEWPGSKLPGGDVQLLLDVQGRVQEFHYAVDEWMEMK